MYEEVETAVIERVYQIIWQRSDLVVNFTI